MRDTPLNLLNRSEKKEWTWEVKDTMYLESAIDNPLAFSSVGVRYSVDVKAGILASGPTIPTPPPSHSDKRTMVTGVSFPVTVAGPRQNLTDFPNTFISLSNHITIIFVVKKNNNLPLKLKKKQSNVREYHCCPIQKV
jgi:hypothetical protein